MARKKIVVMGIVASMVLSLTACGGGNTESSSSVSSTTESVSSNSEESVSEAESQEESQEESAPTNDITIDQIDYSVGEEIDDGERDVFMQITNNSDYTISGFDIAFVEKASITDEEKEAFYSDLQEKYEMSEDDITELRGREISMHAESEKLIPSGQKIGKIHLYYYQGSYYMRSLAHYDLVEPDIATIKYVKDGKIYTEYYDYRSGNYSMDEETEEAYAWGKESPLAELVTKPDVEVCKVEFDRDDVFWFYAYGCSLDDFNAYVEDCKGRGFTEDADAFDDAYFAYDKNGNRISINYDEEDGSISVDVDAADGSAQSEASETPEESESTESAESSSEVSTGTVFEPQDVSDATIESIETYGDYLVMYEMIVNDYLANYESTLKDTVLYDEASFQERKDEMDEEFRDQEEEYGSMKDQKIVGKDGIVDYLKSYRDTLQSMVDSYADMVEAMS